jgi:hypothetical protein
MKSNTDFTPFNPLKRKNNENLKINDKKRITVPINMGYVNLISGKTLEFR